MPAPPVSEHIHEDALAGLVRQWADTRLRDSSQTGELYNRLLGVVEPPLLRAVIQHFHGQCATAARRLGMHRTTLRKKLDQFGIADS
jgi:DNA-binding protein Fis